MSKMVAAVFLAVASASALAQTRTPSDPSDALIERILNADPAAVNQAGLTGRREFIPYLRRVLHDPRLFGSPQEGAWGVRIALGRLGDVEELQRFWCEANREDELGIVPILDPFDLIGGWYAFQALDRFLSPEGQVHFYRAATHKNPGDADVIHAPPKFLAIESLGRLVPDARAENTVAPKSTFGGALDANARAWREWIARNKAVLEKREPTGEGVDWSESACKKEVSGKKR